MNRSYSVYLPRHGETAWSLMGHHSRLTNLPLTERGQHNALAPGERLCRLNFDRAFTSPLQRARGTGELAGIAAQAEVDRDLLEWNYGEYGRFRTSEIHGVRPGWHVFRDGCPGGESPDRVGPWAISVLSESVRVHESKSLGTTPWAQNRH